MLRRHRALADDDFWELVAVLEGRVDDEALERLTEVLRARGPKVARAFQERLAKALYDLDREEFADLPIRWSDEEDDDEPIPLSDDSFVYLRAAVVARGRAAYEEILADPRAALTRRWDDGEGLLYLAEEVTGDDVDTRYSYETGSNDRYWTEREEEPLPWGEGPCPVLVEIRDLSDPVTVLTDSFSGEGTALDGTLVQADGAEGQKRTVYLSPRYLRSELPTELGAAMAQVLLDAGGVPEEVGAPVIEVTVDIGETACLVPEIGEPRVASDPFGWDDLDGADGVLVRPVRVTVPGVGLRAVDRAGRERVLTGLVAACVLAVLPEDHPTRAVLEGLRAEGAADLA